MVVIPYAIVAKAFLSDFAPLIPKKARSSAARESTPKLFDLIRPGDFIKLKLLGRPTLQFSGRFNRVETDDSFWQPPSLAGNEWEFSYRPAIVASVEGNVIVHQGRKGITLSVYPLMMRKEGLDELPEYMPSRYIPLDASTLGTDSPTPQAEPRWTIANTYIYDTCVTLTVSVDPYLMSVSRSRHCLLLVSDSNHPQEAELGPIYWRLKTSADLMKVTEHLQLANPPLEAGQSIRPEDRDETIYIKKREHCILQTVLAELVR
jgi:hypothetical protein